MSGFILWAALILLSAAATYELIQQGRAEFAFEYSTLTARLATAAELDPTVAEYAKARGDFWLNRSVPPRPHLAQREYRRALERNPFEAIHWSDWAQVCRHLGNSREAEKALGVALSLDPNNGEIQRAIGDFLLAQGDLAAAARHHARAIQLNRRLAPAVYTVYWNLGRSPLSVAEDLLCDDPPLLRRHFLDCLTWADVEDIEPLWQALRRREETPDPRCHGAYFDFLVAKKEFQAAQRLWRQIARELYSTEWDPEANGVWNGDFRLPLVFHGGLEWRIAKNLPDGVRAAVTSPAADERSHHLWIHFDGKENTAFSHVRHLVFVSPGKTYRLRYRVNTLEITTDNGPYVRLTIHSDPPVHRKGRVVTGTGRWEVEEQFVVPPTAHWAELVICRDRSAKLNNRIKGDVWYDDFALDVCAEPTSGTVTR